MLHLDAKAWQVYEKNFTAPCVQLSAHLPRDPEVKVYEEAHNAYKAAASLDEQLALVDAASRESYQLADVFYLRAMMRYTANVDNDLSNDDFDAAYAGTVSKPYILFGYALLRSFPNEERQHYIAATKALVQGISALGRRSEVLQNFDRYALSLCQHAQTLLGEDAHKAAKSPLRKLIVIRAALWQLQPTNADAVTKYLQALALDLKNQLAIPALTAADIHKGPTMQAFYERTYTDVQSRVGDALPASAQLAYIEILQSIHANSKALAQVEVVLTKPLTDKEFAQAVYLKIKILQILNMPSNDTLCKQALERLRKLKDSDGEAVVLKAKLLGASNDSTAHFLIEHEWQKQPKNRDLFLNYIVALRYVRPDKALLMLNRDYGKGLFANNMQILMLLCELAHINNSPQKFLHYFPLLDKQLRAYAAMMGTLHPYHTLLTEWYQSAVRELPNVKNIDMLKSYAASYLSTGKSILATLATPAEDKGIVANITPQDIKQKRKLALQCCEVAIAANHLLIEAYEVAVDIYLLENNLPVALDFLYKGLNALDRSRSDSKEIRSLRQALLYRCNAIFEKALLDPSPHLIENIQQIIHKFSPAFFQAYEPMVKKWLENGDLILLLKTVYTSLKNIDDYYKHFSLLHQHETVRAMCAPLLNVCNAIFKKILSSGNTILIDQVEDLVDKYGPTFEGMWQKNKALVEQPFLPFPLPILSAEEKIKKLKQIVLRNYCLYMIN